VGRSPAPNFRHRRPRVSRLWGAPTAGGDDRPPADHCGHPAPPRPTGGRPRAGRGSAPAVVCVAVVASATIRSRRWYAAYPPRSLGPLFAFGALFPFDGVGPTAAPRNREGRGSVRGSAVVARLQRIDGAVVRPVDTGGPVAQRGERKAATSDIWGLCQNQAFVRTVHRRWRAHRESKRCDSRAVRPPASLPPAESGRAAVGEAWSYRGSVDRWMLSDLGFSSLERDQVSTEPG
jgi:hypothetical protein